MRNQKLNTERMEAVIGEFKQYDKELKKCNVDNSTLRYINSECVIELKTEVFEKGSRKAFPRTATKTDIQNIDVRQYLCYLSSVGAFGDRIEKGYTVAGYIANRLTCTNPSKTKKIVRSFKITPSASR